MSEKQLREDLVRYARSMFERGYSSGGAGNISLKLSDGNILATPTNSSFGDLNADELSKVTMAGELLSGQKASKEVLMHLAMYRQRPQCGAIVHLHSPWLTALSCLPGIDPENALPPITPYYVMRVGKLPVIPYIRPGSPRIAGEVEKLAAEHNAILLANHGPVISGKDIREAVFNAEELEETAKLYFMLKPFGMNTLTRENVDELNATFHMK
ncbi:3-oxo-tetronate 4-phosphate decarboxylase [Citrobacter rodentium]|jgi:Ribulose-5-phosphate 4-epimerase and related epimerases and aldolases|uniref:3-oxo-tetronate 4-phosphate decarboxylase n=2 Tax=Citrobacter rodentium TaxID=67825 RepID=D2TUE8_CITRI|nr:aldolase [Citrobacter rodentium]KIQ49371.1 aldolase [Citrobacter rodentium]QBY27844.1 aldolase [Citrobacter rodentium]UHO30268.1 aldolase [Citrobacter rodentium NBRC 105723 = DSM 16636]CBG88001.1 putative sugar aldolase [Citrobacter rodentium ICC168]HAT8013864.1 aldolase [Citrobacter rodentium NBRC 105723 = DSM 16636]